MYNIFVWKIKKYSIQSFKECLFFAFYLFCFLLLSNNTLHVMFYTYICYWNTFHCKYIIQITFDFIKQSHARVTSKNIFLLFVILFICQFLCLLTSPQFYSLKRSINYCCRFRTILCMIFKKTSVHRSAM